MYTNKQESPNNSYRDTPVTNKNQIEQSSMSVTNDGSDIYESNIKIVKQYLEVLYNSSSKEQKNLPILLKNIVDDELLDDYKPSDINVSDEYHYETKLGRADITASKDMVIAIYELKTITTANENKIDYLLQVTINNDGKIDKILRNDVISR